MTPEPEKIKNSYRGGQENKFAIYDIKTITNKGGLSLSSFYYFQKNTGLNYPSILHSNRYIVGNFYFLTSIIYKM